MKYKILIIFLFLLLLTGCWNYRELNQLAIATGMAIDYEDGKYKVSVLISNSKKSQVSSKEGESQTLVYYDTGNTISEAIKNINLKIPKEIYIGHLSVIVINEEIAYNGLYPILDYFLREPESLKRFYLVISKGDAHDVISILSPLEAFPSQNIYFNIKKSVDSQAISPSVTYSKFVETILNKGFEPVLPTITIEGDTEEGQDGDNLQKSVPDANLKLETVAIFNKDKLIGYADELESKGINFINGKVSSTTITYENNQNYITINLASITVKKNVEIIDNKLIANIKFESDAAIREISDSTDLDNVETINLIKKNTENNIKELIDKGFKCAIKYKSDIFGFGNIIYKKDPDLFNSINNWNDYFKNIDYNIDINIKLQTKGSLENTIGGLQNERTN